MAYFSWSSDLAVGNSFIDEDHKKLIDLINRLHDVMAKGDGRGHIGKVLESLIQYTLKHFEREEKEMDRIKYVGSIAHKKEHAKLVMEVSDLQKKFQGGNSMLTMSVSQFLKDWLINHISKTDKAFATAIKLSRA